MGRVLFVVTCTESNVVMDTLLVSHHHGFQPLHSLLPRYYSLAFTWADLTTEPVSRLQV